MPRDTAFEDVRTAYAKLVRRDMPVGRRHTQLWLDRGCKHSFIMVVPRELVDGEVVLGPAGRAFRVSLISALEVSQVAA